jgi:hypothetical protein
MLALITVLEKMGILTMQEAIEVIKELRGEIDSHTWRNSEIFK